MAYTKTNWIDGETPINAENLNKIEEGIKNATLETYPVGSVYFSEIYENPTSIFGGTWELSRTFTGGELIGYGYAYNSSSNNNEVASGEILRFSDELIPNKIYTVESIIDDVLKFELTTFSVKSKNIVGMVEAEYTISGYGTGDAWWYGNGSTLPSGVTMLNGSVGAIKNMGKGTESYSGASNTYYYKIDNTVDGETLFYINPTAMIYNGSFQPCRGGTKCSLAVKVYAKNETTYVWKRTA